MAVRNIRRDVMHDLRELKKEGEIGEDDERRAEADLQKHTDGADRRDRGAAEGQGRGDPGGLGARPASGHAGTSRSSPTATAAGRSSADWRRSRATAPGPTWSRSACATRSSSDVEELTVFSFSTENWSRPPREVEGLMRMFAERIDRETPELDDEGVRMRFIGRREGIDAELAGAHGVGRGPDRRTTTGSPSSSPSTTAARGDRRCGAAVRGRERGGVPDPPLRAGDARPRPPDPDQRRAAGLQLPAVAVRLLRARLPRRAVARLHPRGVRGVA